VGTTDIIVDYYHAIQAGVPAMAGQLGATYGFTVLYVPLLMITHVVILLVAVHTGWEVANNDAVDTCEKGEQICLILVGQLPARLPKPGSQAVSALPMTPKLARLLRGEARPSGFS
jgi:hypothetical protein